MSLSLNIIFILGLPATYFIWTKLFFWLAMRRAGCSSPVKYKHSDPILGLDLLRKKDEARNRGDSRAVDRQIFSTYGKTVRTIVLGKNYFVTMDSRNMQTILATEVEKFGSAPMNREPCKPFVGDGIITTDGALWKRSRQLINPVFTRAQISELPSFEVHVQRMINKIPRDGSVVDMQVLCKMLFLDNSTEFIFGKSANSLSPTSLTSNIVAQGLPEAFNAGLRGMRKRFMLPKVVLRLMRKDKIWLEKCAEVHSIIDSFIDEEIENQKTNKDSADGNPYGYVLLKELVKITDDKLFIRNELMNIFFRLVTQLEHPDVWLKLRQEVVEIGEQKSTFELLKSLKYLQAVINETLRILAPVDGSWKICLAPCVLPRGGGNSGQDPILLQPGDQVEMVFGLMHRDPAIWGENAQYFLPERWEGRKQGWDYIPFMGGRRICPAQQNVLTDISFVLVKLLQEFKTCINKDECVEYVEQHVFTKESRNGVKVAFVPA